MSHTRRTLIGSLLGAGGAALAQTFTGTGETTIGFKADTIPQRSECGMVSALNPMVVCPVDFVV